MNVIGGLPLNLLGQPGRLPLLLGRHAALIECRGVQILVIGSLDVEQGLVGGELIPLADGVLLAEAGEVGGVAGGGGRLGRSAAQGIGAAVGGGPDRTLPGGHGDGSGAGKSPPTASGLQRPTGSGCGGGGPVGSGGDQIALRACAGAGDVGVGTESCSTTCSSCSHTSTDTARARLIGPQRGIGDGLGQNIRHLRAGHHNGTTRLKLGLPLHNSGGPDDVHIVPLPLLRLTTTTTLAFATTCEGGEGMQHPLQDRPVRLAEGDGMTEQAEGEGEEALAEEGRAGEGGGGYLGRGGGAAGGVGGAWCGCRGGGGRGGGLGRNSRGGSSGSRAGEPGVSAARLGGSGSAAVGGGLLLLGGAVTGGILLLRHVCLN